LTLGKAKVEILQQRVAGNKTFIEVDVEIKGIKNRRRYEVPNDATYTEIQEYIKKEIIKEEYINVGKEFEVKL